MSIIVLPTTWSDNQVLTASALNSEFTTIVNDYNGGITNANIAPNAAIATSKVAFPVAESSVTFSGSGHGHSGGTDGKIISKNVTYAAFIAGAPSIANDQGINPRVRAATTITRISAYARTAPTGSSLTVQVYDITQSAIVASLSITTGNNSSTATSITTASLNSGDILRYDVTAQGSSVLAANITIQIDGTE